MSGHRRSSPRRGDERRPLPGRRALRAHGQPGQFPPLLGRRFAGRAPAGLLLTALIAIVLAAFFDLSSIASIGSAIALMVFTLVSVAHVRARDETGANLALLVTAIGATVAVLVAFALTTLVDEPETAVAIVVITALSIGLDVATKRPSRV